jgi:hypothetical protein
MVSAISALAVKESAFRVCVSCRAVWEHLCRVQEGRVVPSVGMRKTARCCCVLLVRGSLVEGLLMHQDSEFTHTIVRTTRLTCGSR